jgi:hypothetical protein
MSAASFRPSAAYRGLGAWEDEAEGDQFVDGCVPPPVVAVDVAVQGAHLVGGEGAGGTGQGGDRVGVVAAGVCRGRGDDVGQADAADCVAVLVAPAEGRWARLDLDRGDRSRGRCAMDSPFVTYTIVNMSPKKLEINLKAARRACSPQRCC